jgi:hypothetical protein
VGDFNGDGAPDVVVNEQGASLVSRYRSRPGHFSLLLNDGRGALHKPSYRRMIHSSSGRIVVGDGDADGDLDVLVGTRYGAHFSSGNGDGTFDAPTIVVGNGRVSSLGFFAGQGPTPVRAWAVGGSSGPNDGPYTDAGFEVLFSDADGLLQRRYVKTVDGYPLVRMGDDAPSAAVADFNEDGYVDVVIQAAHWRLSRFFGSADNLFTPALLEDRYMNLLTSTDLNGDGHADLVGVDRQELWTYLGKGDGNFSTGLMTPLPTRPSQLVVADADADGKPDVVLVHRDAAQVSVWRGNGLGRFDAPVVLATGRQPSDAAVADLDRDGVPELLVAEAGDNVVSVYTVPRAPVTEAAFTPRCPMVLQDAVAEGASPEPLLSMDTGMGNADHTELRSLFADVGDFDGNGHRDLALVTYGRGMRLLLGDGEGHFQPRDVLPDGFVWRFAAGDFNGDGLTDLAVIPSNGGLQLRWSDGRGFPDITYVPVPGDSGGAVMAADFNRDGLMDLGASISTRCGARGILLTNQGGGVMKQELLPDHNVEPDDQCGGGGPPLVADFNGDGMLDLVHHTLAFNLNYTTQEGTVVPGEGFAPWYFGGGGAESAADVDGDGAVDLLLSGPGGMTVVRGDGGGTFEASLSCRLNVAGQALFQAADVNADGIVDLLGMDPSGAVLVVMGEGGGSYRSVLRYPLETKPVWAAPVDVLGDGQPELVVLTASGTLKVFPTP